jgi:hypothetical protein
MQLQYPKRRDDVASVAPPADPLPGAGSRTEPRGRWALALAACLVYAAIRAVSIAVAAYRVSLGKVAHWNMTLPQLLGSWDANRYQIIAAHGYSYFLGARQHNSLFAWFPGYPALIRLFAWIPGVGYPGAAFGVAMAAGLVAACGLAVLVTDLTSDRRVALLTVALWAAAPGSLVLDLEYPESLFCALAAWSLVFLVRRRWLTAAALAALAGTVHSTGAALAAAFGVAAVAAIARAWRYHESARACLRPLAALAIAPLGLLSYWAYVGVDWGQPTAWFSLEHDMRNGFDWGRSLRDHIALLSSTAPNTPKVAIALTLGVLALAALLVIALLFFRIPWGVRFFPLALVIIAICTGPMYFGSKPRYLIPAMMLLMLPLAAALVRLLGRRRAATGDAGRKLRRWGLPAWALALTLAPVITAIAIASTWYSLYIMNAPWAL